MRDDDYVHERVETGAVKPVRYDRSPRRCGSPCRTSPRGRRPSPDERRRMTQRLPSQIGELTTFPATAGNLVVGQNHLPVDEVLALTKRIATPTIASGEYRDVVGIGEEMYDSGSSTSATPCSSRHTIRRPARSSSSRCVSSYWRRISTVPSGRTPVDHDVLEFGKVCDATATMSLLEMLHAVEHDGDDGDERPVGRALRQLAPRASAAFNSRHSPPPEVVDPVVAKRELPPLARHEQSRIVSHPIAVVKNPARNPRASANPLRRACAAAFSKSVRRAPSARAMRLGEARFSRMNRTIVGVAVAESLIGHAAVEISLRHTRCGNHVMRHRRADICEADDPDS